MEEKKYKQAKYYRRAIVVLLVLFFCYYFFPVSLGAPKADGYDVYVVRIITEYKNGVTDVDSTEYKAFTDMQKNSLVDLMNSHKRMRRFGTEISEARMDNFSRVYYVSFIPKDGTSNTISYMLSENGHLIIDDKNFRYFKAKKFVTEIEYLLATVQPEE